MNRLAECRLLVVYIVIGIIQSGCASTTMIKSDPAGASVYVSEQLIGKTPVSFSDLNFARGCTSIRLKKEGYESSISEICRDAGINLGAIIGGFFTFGLTFAWYQDHPRQYVFALEREGESSKERHNIDEGQVFEIGTTRALGDELRVLEQMMDDKLLTGDEYQKRRKEIFERHSEN